MDTLWYYLNKISNFERMVFMKKGILSFTVVLAFAIVNVLGCFSAAAVEGASVVARKIYVDDDFNAKEYALN